MSCQAKQFSCLQSNNDASENDQTIRQHDHSELKVQQSAAANGHKSHRYKLLQSSRQHDDPELLWLQPRANALHHMQQLLQHTLQLDSILRLLNPNDNCFSYALDIRTFPARSCHC
jgi:hypothetical protein